MYAEATVDAGAVEAHEYAEFRGGLLSDMTISIQRVRNYEK